MNCFCPFWLRVRDWVFLCLCKCNFIVGRLSFVFYSPPKHSIIIANTLCYSFLSSLSLWYLFQALNVRSQHKPRKTTVSEIGASWEKVDEEKERVQSGSFERNTLSLSMVACFRCYCFVFVVCRFLFVVISFIIYIVYFIRSLFSFISAYVFFLFPDSAIFGKVKC